MFFFDLMEIFGWVSDAVAGWSWDAVERGMYSWAAESAVASVEFVYVTLTERTRPQVDAPWFRRGLAVPVYLTALYIGSVSAAVQTVRLLLSRRPELIGPAFVRSAKLGLFIGGGTWFIAKAMLAGDALSNALWANAAGGSVELLLEAYIAEMVNPDTPVVGSLIGVLLALVVMVGMFASVAALLVRNILVYVVAAYGAIPVALSVDESNKGFVRELVLVVVTLALSPSVMVFSLMVSAASVMGEFSTGVGGELRLSGLGLVVSSLSLAITGFVPFALYRFLPALSQGAGVTGVVSGVGKSVAGLAQGVLLGAGLASAASRVVGAVPSAKPPASPPKASDGRGGVGGGGGGSGNSGGSGWSKASSVVVATNPLSVSPAGGGSTGGGSLVGAVGRSQPGGS